MSSNSGCKNKNGQFQLSSILFGDTMVPNIE